MNEITIIRICGEHDADLCAEIEQTLRLLTGKGNFHIENFKVNDWNRDLPPWKSAPVFGDQSFGSGAKETLEEVLKFASKLEGDCYLGGYSLAGLFTLWASYQTHVFKGVASVSPSVWYPGWIPYAKENQCLAKKVYLSLGDKEEKTRNKVMATVGDAIMEQKELLDNASVLNRLDFNPGSHFMDVPLRMAKGFAWLLNE